MKRKRWFVIAALLLLVTALVAMLGWRGENGWAEIGSVEELRDAFNRDSSSTRIVLLLSPT